MQTEQINISDNTILPKAQLTIYDEIPARAIACNLLLASPGTHAVATSRVARTGQLIGSLDGATRSGRPVAYQGGRLA